MRQNEVKLNREEIIERSPRMGARKMRVRERNKIQIKILVNQWLAGYYRLQRERKKEDRET